MQKMRKCHHYIIRMIQVMEIYLKYVTWLPEIQCYDHTFYSWIISVNGRWALTAIPKRVMPFFSQSAITAFVIDESCDSPSVTTTITLAAFGRPPFWALKPTVLKGEDKAGYWIYLWINETNTWFWCDKNQLTWQTQLPGRYWSFPHTSALC